MSNEIPTSAPHQQGLNAEVRYNDFTTRYANHVLVNVGQEEVYLDFTSGIVPDSPGTALMTIHTRIAMTPSGVVRLTQVLNETIQTFQRTSVFESGAVTPKRNEIIVAEVGAQKNSATILDKAAQDGRVEIVKTLIKENPDLVFSKDCEGYTALHWAARKGYRDMAEWLLANRAEVDAKTEIGWAPLHLAAANGQKGVAECLLANRAEVNATTNHGATPLLLAADNDFRAVAELLLTSKAKIDAKDNDSHTPLHYAAYKGHYAMAELLIANMADVNAKARHRHTPLDAAKENGHPDVAELLRQHGGYERADL